MYGGRPEQHAVHDAEHRGVRADTEAEREDHGGGESGLGAQASDRVAKILDEGV
jgi:hypothetical protein